MALLKEKIDNKGIITNYHKIIQIQNGGQLVIVVHSYASEEYRERERFANEKMNRTDYLIQNSAILNEEEQEELDELLQNQPEYAKDLELFISEKMYIVDTLGDFSFEDAYAYLKSLDDFIDAEDV